MTNGFTITGQSPRSITMKSYSAPQLVPVGRVVEKTQGSFVSNEDPSQTQQALPAGSVGYGL